MRYGVTLLNASVATLGDDHAILNEHSPNRNAAFLQTRAGLQPAQREAL